MVEQVKDEVAAQAQSWTSKNVKLATTTAEKENIYRLRYEVYIEEMGGGARHTEADPAKRQLRDEMDETAYHFYVDQNGQTVACLRNNLRRDGPFECEAEFEMPRFTPAYPDDVSMTSRLLLHPKLRGNYVLTELVSAAFEFLVLGAKTRFIFIDCHPRLIPLYARLGFRIYTAGFRHPKYIYVVPMVLVVGDVEHLKKVKSPFASIAASVPSLRADRDVLLSQFPDANQSPMSNELEQTEFWQLLHKRLLDPTATIAQTSLFSGLTKDQLQFLTSFGHAVRCKSGDRVLMQGDPGREVFVIMEGSFRIRAQGNRLIFKVLTTGDIFGEIAFLTNGLRAASAVALEDASLLILHARALDQLIATKPTLAAALFHNMASIVATRLRDSVGF